MKHVLAVYGSNQRTEYLLFNEDGQGVDCLLDGTANHEAVGFDGARSCLHTRIRQMLERNRLQPEHIKAAVFGLAGADTPKLQDRLLGILSDTGLSGCRVTNDAALGIFAGTSLGYGVCSVNADGTVVLGIDASGALLQVGGLGRVTGDDAGLGFLGKSAVRAVYDYFFRCGQATMLTDEILPLLGIRHPEGLLDAIIAMERTLAGPRFTQTLFACAAMDDAVARGIMQDAACAMAASVAGCIGRLAFDGAVEIVLAGSVWEMPESEFLINLFQDELARRCARTLRYKMLDCPLAAGAAIAALGGPALFPFESRQRERLVQQTLRLLENA